MPVRPLSAENSCSQLRDLSTRELCFSPDFTPAEFAARRRRMTARIGADAYLLVPSAPPSPTLRPLQDACFHYFCGLDLCHAYLLMHGPDSHTTLFLPGRDQMDGPQDEALGHEDADSIVQRLGVDAVLPSSQLTAALEGARHVYLPMAEAEGGGLSRFEANRCARRRAEDPWDQTPSRVDTLQRLLRERVPGVRVDDACPHIDILRRIKSEAEISVLREAAGLSALAVTEAMKATRPGLTETRLQAIVDYVFRDQGHCASAYHTIVAAGQNSWDGHYHRNTATIAPDDLILMDCGPQLRHYASDICRIWPASGTYSREHRRAYGFIVDYHQVLLSLIKPGLLVADIYAEADRIMAARYADPGYIYGDMRYLHEPMMAKGVNYLNHSVGMSTHDPAGPYRSEPLEAGFVVAVDPMVWWDEPHLYIRVEDTVLVTADGCEALTADAPLELDDVEALMRQDSPFSA